MELIVMRHGEAETYAASDRARNLTRHGRQQAVAAGKWLVEHSLTAEHIWVSPYPRAQQTAECVQLAMGLLPSTTQDFLQPGSSPVAVLDHLSQSHYSRLLIVSHNPMISQLVNYLASGTLHGPAAMGTASIAKFSADEWLAGCCELDWLRHAPNFENSL
jgi:phosphohistidine phosphatase SixA